jgi:2-polyprenyl-6-methoxyphenol hydroxylase-like FAD-dependent oxidoreductase
MRAIVIGGGIGGLTTALSLHRAGIEAAVFEQVPALKPLGVGINLLPHAVRELTELGLADRLAAIAIPTRELIYANRHGQEIWREARGREAGYGWPQFSIHRGQLQMLLLEVARERLGADRIHVDHALTGFSDDGRTVTAHFAGQDGSARPEATGDVLIAAGSLVREGERLESGYLDAGLPAKKIKPLTDEQLGLIRRLPDNYIMYAQWFPELVG